jgi:hypothetical protein
VQRIEPIAPIEHRLDHDLQRTSASMR